jgi:uroporphyrinogen-III decarboxylase
MTSRERLLCAMRGGTPDRVPVSPYGMGRISPDSDLGKEMIAKLDILYDAGASGDWMFGGAAVRHAEEIPGGRVETVETPKGPLTRRWQRTAITSAQMEFAIKTPEDAERFFSIPYEPPVVDASGHHAACARIGEDGLVLCGIGDAICLAADLLSPEHFCLAWAERPELMEKLTAVAAERLNAHVEDLCRQGVKAFRIVGGEYVSVQLGPRAFARLITPHDTALIDIIHRHGAIAYYHNHGHVTRYLTALRDLGMDALDPLEAPPWGDCDLREARRICGNLPCFVGNLDDMEVVESLPTDEVLRIARERRKAAGPSSFVLGGTASGCYTEPGARNFIAMAEMVAAES